MKTEITKSKDLPSSKQDIHYAEVLTLLLKCSETKNIDDALKIITNEACKLAGGMGGSIWLVSNDDSDKIILRWTYRPEGPNKVGESFYSKIIDKEGFYNGLTGWVFGTGQPLCLRDITDEQEIAKYPHLRWVDKYKGFTQAANKKNQKHFMAVPIFSCRSKGKVIGVLRLGATSTEKPFDDFQLKILQTYAGYISGLLTNFLKSEEEKRLLDMFFAVASQSDIETLLDEATRTIPIVMDGSHSSIFLKDDEGNLCLVATSAPHLKQYTRINAKSHCLKYNLGVGKTGIVGLTGKSIRVKGNITSDAGISHNLCECGVSSGAFLCSPIWDRNGNPEGVVRVVRDLKLGGEFDEEDEHFLDGFGQKLYKCLSFQGYFTKGTCFVIMPFNKGLEGIYFNVIQPTVQEFNYVCKREDEFAFVGNLSKGVVSHIANATFIIADLTGYNPNVYYELGIAHTLNKMVIIISQDPCPSDISDWKYVHYTDKMESAKPLEDELKKAIKDILSIQRHIASKINC